METFEKMRYYLYSKKDEGLFDKEQLRGLDIDKDDLVKKEDGDCWIEAGRVDELADLFIPPVDFDSECGFSDDGSTQEPADGVGAGAADAGCPSSDESLPLVVEQRLADKPSLAFGKGRMAAFAAVLLALVLLGSNPKKNDHYMVAQQMVINGLQAQDHSRSWGESLMDMFFGGFSFFDSFTTSRIMNDVECHNAFLFSYSKVTDEEAGSHWITFGVLGHIFPMNQEALNEHISHVLYGTRRHQPEKKQTPRRKQQQTVPEGGQSL